MRKIRVSGNLEQGSSIQQGNRGRYMGKNCYIEMHRMAGGWQEGLRGRVLQDGSGCRYRPGG